MKRLLLFAAFSLFFAQLVFMLSGYGINVFIARFLGPESYGIYSVVIALVTLFSLSLVSGAQAATSKFVSQSPKNSAGIKKAALKLNLLIGMVVFAAYFLLSDHIAMILQDPNLAPYLRASSLIIPPYFLYPVFLGYFNGLRQYKKQAMLSIFYSVAKFSAIILLVLSGFMVFGAIIGFVVAPTLGLLAGLYFSRSKQATLPFSQKKILCFAVPITIFVISFEASLSIGLFSLKSMLLENEFVGYYNAALQLSKLPYYFNLSLSAALFPFVSSSFSSNGREELLFHIKKAFKYFIAFVLPSSILIGLLSQPLVVLIFGGEFSLSAAPLSILSIASIFFCFFYLLSIVLMGIERQKMAMLLSILTLAIAWLSNLVLIPIFYLNGAALATLIAFLAGSILAAIAVYTYLPKAIKASG